MNIRIEERKLRIKISEEELGKLLDRGKVGSVAKKCALVPRLAFHEEQRDE